jgi:hypothetical protein
MLLNDEAYRLIPEGEKDQVIEGREELLSLLKMVLKLTPKENIGESSEEILEEEVTLPDEDLPKLPEVPEESSIEEEKELGHTLSSQAAEVSTVGFDALLQKLKAEILEELHAKSEETAVRAVKISTKSIVEFLKKKGLG